MSSKIEMVSVPRDLLNDVLKTIHGLQPGRFSVEQELRAILAQPVADEQAEPDPAQDERKVPLVVAEVEVIDESEGSGGGMLSHCHLIQQVGDGAGLMTVAQHERIVAALTRPVQAEQQPVGMLKVRDLFPTAHWSEGEHSFVWLISPDEQRALPKQDLRLYAAPVAQAAPQPSKWSEFVERAARIIGAEQQRLSAEDYLMDSDDCVKVLREAVATPQPEQSGLVEALENLKEAVEFTPLGVRGIQAVAHANGALAAYRAALAAQGGE